MIGGHSGRSGSRLLPVLGASVLALSLAPQAFAAVERSGEWPADEKKVTLDVDRVSREEAIKRLAAAAGWSIVVHAPSADPVDIHVQDQPADKVLALLLDDANYRAKRDGSLLSISRVSDAAAAVAPVPPVPAVPPVPPVPAAMPTPPVVPAVPAPPAPMKRQGKDREVVSQNLVIEKGEVVRDVHVAGGSLEIRGTVTGDVEVVGGTVTVDNGAQVMGDVEVMLGSVSVKNGGRIEGDAVIVGGKLNREEGGVIGGDVSSRGEESTGEGGHEHEEQTVHTNTHFISDAGETITGGALLFALGAVLLALFTKRAESLKVEVAARPMRMFALGIVGSLGALALFVALCVTVIGIPVAVVGLLAGTIGVFAAMCSVLEVVGKALIGHKTSNEYVHLAFGCGLFLLAGALPWIGGLVKAAVALIAIGTLVATRGAGLIPQRKGNRNGGSDAHPYRSADAL
jgi:cytoskeletal protein CcmA (bactofilin family)